MDHGAQHSWHHLVLVISKNRRIQILWDMTMGIELPTCEFLGDSFKLQPSQDEIISLPYWKFPSESQWHFEDSPSSFLWLRWLNQIWLLTLALDQVGSSVLLSSIGHLLQPSKSSSLSASEVGITGYTLRSQFQSVILRSQLKQINSTKSKRRFIQCDHIGENNKEISVPTSPSFVSRNDIEI
jgi:hypothetical protein